MTPPPRRRQMKGVYAATRGLHSWAATLHTQNEVLRALAMELCGNARRLVDASRTARGRTT